MSIIIKKYFILLLEYILNFLDAKSTQSNTMLSVYRWYWSLRINFVNSLTGDELCREKEKMELDALGVIQIRQKIKNGILESKIDSALPAFSHDSSWEFLNPFSEEFRGIYELYGLVMYKLLLIFAILIILVVHTLYKDFIIIYENREEIVKIIKKNGFNLRRSYVEVDYFCCLAEVAKIREGEEGFVKTEGWILATQIYNKTKVRADSFLGKIERFLTKFHAFTLKSNLLAFCSVLEFYWTAIPCIILVFISIPSFTLALALDETHKPEAWIKIVGNQWFWTYEYSGYAANFSIASNVVYNSDLTNNSLRLLQPDIAVTLPCNKVTRILVTSVDVIHCWAVPSLGVKIDAVPGRVNSLSILPTRAGFYYGQCSEICGVNHGFMPICVEVI